MHIEMLPFSFCFNIFLLQEELSDSLEKMSELLERKKAEIESLRKQLTVVTNEKRQYEQQWMKTQADLDKKVS